MVLNIILSSFRALFKKRAALYGYYSLNSFSCQGKSDCFQGIDSCESHAKESFFDERLHDLGSLDVEPSDPNTDMTHR